VTGCIEAGLGIGAGARESVATNSGQTIEVMSFDVATAVGFSETVTMSDTIVWSTDTDFVDGSGSSTPPDVSAGGGGGGDVLSEF
jgi:hypothetical protein